eukprot:CAMPEP_0177633858 /NCGR_PEP_ID=MMETSP0447-20121125/3062_1 /TAXON_ID=0 /ORGANISM="Stygamoeba regulata, Strain BSH-02190019" /LENGTH=182 /DNA_ID=CAMNT_0019135547 /DNA_START=193 /DNA_END=741 /DNA_ORIENTATION=-
MLVLQEWLEVGGHGAVHVCAGYAANTRKHFFVVNLLQERQQRLTCRINRCLLLRDNVKHHERLGGIQEFVFKGVRVGKVVLQDAARLPEALHHTGTFHEGEGDVPAFGAAGYAVPVRVPKPAKALPEGAFQACEVLDRHQKSRQVRLVVAEGTLHDLQQEVAVHRVQANEGAVQPRGGGTLG